MKSFTPALVGDEAALSAVGYAIAAGLVVAGLAAAFTGPGEARTA